MKLQNLDKASIDIVKLTRYALDMNHPEGRHKARVFLSALGITAADGEWLAQAILEALPAPRPCCKRPPAGESFIGQTWRSFAGNAVRRCARHGFAMRKRLIWSLASCSENAMKLLDVVAITEDMPDLRLSKGQVGTIVEELDQGLVLVEFADLDGVAYAIAPIPRSKLMDLHHRPALAA
jgi:hypothetical protein